MQDFVDGKVDAFLAFTPESAEAARPEEFSGHTIVNIAVDRPWSQYFCCMVAGSTDYVNKYPVATKRVLRAILKAADFCASNPNWRHRRWSIEAFCPTTTMLWQR